MLGILKHTPYAATIDTVSRCSIYIVVNMAVVRTINLRSKGLGFNPHCQSCLETIAAPHDLTGLVLTPLVRLAKYIHIMSSMSYREERALTGFMSPTNHFILYEMYISTKL